MEDLDRAVAEVVIVAGFGALWAAPESRHRPKAVLEWAVMPVLRGRIVRQDQVIFAVGRVVMGPLDRRAQVAVITVVEARAVTARAVESGATIVAVRVLAASETRVAGRRTAGPTSARTSMSPSTLRMRASPRWRRPSEVHAGRSSCSTSPKR